MPGAAPSTWPRSTQKAAKNISRWPVSPSSRSLGENMTLKAEWEIVGEPIDPDSTDRLFFTEHEWNTVEAAAARIIPTDHQPGAREARVVVFIDRYLSGIDYIYAAADGRGFLKLTGKFADAWRGRIADMQRTYRAGLALLDATAHETFGKNFVDLADDEQDSTLEQ